MEHSPIQNGLTNLDISSQTLPPIRWINVMVLLFVEGIKADSTHTLFFPIVAVSVPFTTLFWLQFLFFNLFWRELLHFHNYFYDILIITLTVILLHPLFHSACYYSFLYDSFNHSLISYHLYVNNYMISRSYFW